MMPKEEMQAVFMERLGIATRRALKRCEGELRQDEYGSPPVTLQLSPTREALTRRVTFMLPGVKVGKKLGPPTILFTCIAHLEAVARPRMTGDGYFGMVAKAYRALPESQRGGRG